MARDGASSEEMLAEHDRVVLTADVSDSHLKAGDTGTIVHVYRSDAAFEVEFRALDGNTAAVATIPSSFVRPATGADITHHDRDWVAHPPLR